MENISYHNVLMFKEQFVKWLCVISYLCQLLPHLLEYVHVCTYVCTSMNINVKSGDKIKEEF